MTRGEKIGVAVLVGLFVLLGLALYATFKPAGKGSHSYEDNVIVRQRTINLNK